LHDFFNHKYISQNVRVPDQLGLYIIDRKMDPNLNGQQWQQQYPAPNQQYAQPLQQQPIGVQRYDYSSAAQQTYYESQYAQQGGSQPSYQGLMQQVPAQQSLPNAQLQQQQSYQHYYQGHSSVNPARSVPAGQWTQTQPNAQWQTATNNATTTTTTTTTTTKPTKETQASQAQHATPSTAFDFSSLMQQLPPQQATQQQQSVNYSQTVQSGNQQQTLPSPAPDFSRFMQKNPPPTQNTVDFSQLLQTAPPPQPQVSQAPPVVQMSTPQKPQSSKQASRSTDKSTNKPTTTTTTTVIGSSSRQEAAKQGKTELRRFDQDISNRLKQFAGSVLCPMGFDYYATRQGYLCGGGTHFFSHESMEAMLKYGQVPELEDVNDDVYDRQVTPPLDERGWAGRERPVWTDWRWVQATRELRRQHELLKSMRNREFR
jgi:hypothetical protein